MDKKPALMTVRSGKGKELSDLLRKELNVPADCKWFEVRFAIDEIVTVKAEYMPRESPENG